jgi:lipopolysaccharide/colanic/teichoic acid biosynthesis glycosyltransferase
VALARPAIASSRGTVRSLPARYRYAKRSLDLLVAALGLIACAPVIGLLALLVRFDSPGPAFFVQLRVGQYGRLFPIFKLRTMRVADPAEAAGFLDDDVRVTRVGRALRRWSLDELPQLINVLRGDMSLVGPRPERPEIVLARYQEWQYARFEVPQGLTGWWQITDRGRRRLCDDSTNDLVYLEQASFWLDLKILVLTLPAVIRQAGLL